MKRECKTQTYSVGEDVVGANSAEEVLADLVVGEVKLNLDDAHGFGTHHLLERYGGVE